MTDVVLDTDRDRVRVEAAVLDCRAADVILDHPQRRGAGAGGLRRALVHDAGDGLTMNYNEDYPGGVTIRDARVQLHVESQRGGAPKLPARAPVGELRAIVTTTMIGQEVVGVNTSLWLCVAASNLNVARLGATWQEVMLGEIVHGTT